MVAALLLDCSVLLPVLLMLMTIPVVNGMHTIYMQYGEELAILCSVQL
jgi:hypothetical protein